MSMNEAYLRSMTLSYSGQGDRADIPAEELQDIVEIPLGFQPLGICSRCIGKTGREDEIVIAAYYEPAICLATVFRDKSGLHFRVSWIRGVDHGIESVRIFPNIFHPGGANRCQTVNFGPGGTLWVSRNADRKFFVLSPPSSNQNRLVLTCRVILPPAPRFVNSALLIDNRLYTVEGTEESSWLFCLYEVGVDGSVKLDQTAEINAWNYGIGIEGGNSPWYVTDFRSNCTRGIYCGSEIKVPDVAGNGICFLSDGSALVTRYGQAHTGCFNGVPGALIYVPCSLFNK